MSWIEGLLRIAGGAGEGYVQGEQIQRRQADYDAEKAAREEERRQRDEDRKRNRQRDDLALTTSILNNPALGMGERPTERTVSEVDLGNGVMAPQPEIDVPQAPLVGAMIRATRPDRTDSGATKYREGTQSIGTLDIGGQPTNIWHDRTQTPAALAARKTEGAEARNRAAYQALPESVRQTHPYTEGVDYAQIAERVALDAAKPEEPKTIRVGGRDFPDSPEGEAEALAWERRHSDAGRAPERPRGESSGAKPPPAPEEAVSSLYQQAKTMFARGLTPDQVRNWSLRDDQPFKKVLNAEQWRRVLERAQRDAEAAQAGAGGDGW